MSILTLLTALLGVQWSTTCVMTQADGKQGFTIDSIAFKNDDHTPSGSKLIEVTFQRTWFEDAQCSQQKDSTSQSGTLLIGSRISENTFEADWTIDGKLQLGAIQLGADLKSLKTATSSFGTSRNTMLSLFPYLAH